MITPKPLVKQFSRLLEDRDKNVREEGKKLLVEMYRWIGVALKPQLVSLKPMQVSCGGGLSLGDYYSRLLALELTCTMLSTTSIQ